MKSRKKFIFGLITGLIVGSFVSLFTVFLSNPILSFSSTTDSYVELYQPIPHYEFSNEEMTYMMYLDRLYKIKPPFYNFGLNSVQEISKPFGYNNVIEKSPYDDNCADWEDKGDKIKISAKTFQSKVPECSVTLKYVKSVKKGDLVDIYFNLSQKIDYSDGVLYEEEGITIKNRFNIPINNYIFIYNQSNNSQIKWDFKDCNELKIFIDQEEIEYRHNFFKNASILAVKFDLEPREIKELIVRCSH
ncbi:MAG: hypothetical protein KAS90_00975 [Candidatus Aenigmarchaeota archaeon]|nr:hypothetical protein [Candidatus Aenigmarchaeota archaeon]